ncbi:polysaccharide pyruvyl transferase family protein [Nesterenkonia haasae]|uniref:polysaccharide pyruvyl transferase family protein n=1 Tax=Nesterenkonia haasae TaxID=2587813 RepID=UPI001390E7FC|nr:polysaccharide pyruvyl transferase family protein [Nesterenkonia haasae]
MHSVDQAAKDFLDERDVDYSLFVAQKRANDKSGDYLLAQDWGDLKEYDKVIYWGDFTVNPTYGHRSFPWRSQSWKIESSRKKAIARWQALFNPEQAPEGKSLYAVGQNFQHDFSADPEKFSPHLKNLQTSFTQVFVRDTFSLQNLSREVDFGYMDNIRLGLDCAFLQKEAARGEDKHPTFAYYFNRSKLENTQELVSYLERRTGLKGVNVARWLGLKKQERPQHFESMKQTIRQSTFALTDTYHFAVNAMNARRPVVSIGRRSAEQTGTLGDFKKKILFRMLDLERFYHEIDDAVLGEQQFRLVGDSAERFLEEEALTSPFGLLETKTSEFTRNLESLLAD